MVDLSVLDLCPIVEGGEPTGAFRNALDLARHAERLGYRRYWLAEHHGMPGIASAATAVVIAHVAGGTSSIRVGAGGIMLPNHSPLVIAEQFGTLESLFPGRIDLGLGRAPGSDQATSRALRRTLAMRPDDFPNDVLELLEYFDEPRGTDGGARPIRAIPGEGMRVPVWILGSSLFGAGLAAELGLPYAFASHFAPQALLPALELYRERFRPSARLERPHVMAGVPVYVADTDEEARYLASSMQQAFVNLRSGRPSRLKPPVRDYESGLSPPERAILEHTMSCAAIGSPATVRRALEDFVARTGADELMLATQIFDHPARVRSYELAAQLAKG